MNAGLSWLIGALLATPALGSELFEQPCSVAQAQAVLDWAMPVTAEVQVLRGRYRQQKYLHEIPRPLESAGDFVMVRDQGLWWRTRTPRESDLALSARGKGSPAASLMLALFVLDLEALARNFELFVIEPGLSPDSQWRLGLRARDTAVAAFFQQVIVSGGDRVEQVTLFETTGDRTEITLDAAPQPLSSLTPAERERLER